MKNRKNTENIITAAIIVIYAWYNPEKISQYILKIPSHPIIFSVIIALAYLQMTYNSYKINNFEEYANKLEKEIDSLKQEVKELKDKNMSEW